MKLHGFPWILGIIKVIKLVVHCEFVFALLELSSWTKCREFLLHMDCREKEGFCFVIESRKLVWDTYGLSDV